MKTYNYEIRAEINATLDFKITALNEWEARKRVGNYLRHVDGGKLDKQAISVKCKDGDQLTNLFVMDCEIQDVNSDEPE